MFIWPDGSVTGSVNHAVLDAYNSAKDAGEDLSPFEQYLGVIPEPKKSEVAEESAAPDSPSASEFDPSEHTVAEVNEYLETATEEERERVLDAESSGKARSTLLKDSEEA